MTKIKNIIIGNNAIPIREFKLDSMCEHASIVMVAKRRSGKSWVCRSILKHFRDIPVGIIIAPTEKMASPAFYSDFFPDTYIHYQYRSEIIEKLLYRQDLMIEKEKEKKKIGNNIDPRGFILMDDCLSSKGSWMREQPIMELLFNGRHYRLMYMLTMQFPLGITPELRCNFDYIFLLKEDTYSNLKRLYDHYAGIFPNFECFRQIFKEVTSDYGSMVIVNDSTGDEFLDKVFWYKAKNDKLDKLIGCDQFIDFHKKNFDNDWKKKKKQINIMDMCVKKKTNTKAITVDKIKNEEDNDE